MSDWWNCQRLNTLPLVDARVSELVKVLDAAEESVYLLTACARDAPRS